MSLDFIFDCLGRKLMSGAEDDQILDASYDPPGPRSIKFALIAGVKPSFAEDFGSLLRPAPVAGENVRAAYDDFIVLGEFHLDAGDRRANAAGDGKVRVIHRADASRFGETVNLEHRNTQHAE